MKYIKLYKPDNTNDSRLYTNFKNHKMYADYMYSYDTFEGSSRYFSVPNILVGYGNPKIVNGKHKLEGKVSIIVENNLVYDSLLHFQVPQDKVFTSLLISIGSQVETRSLLEAKLLMFVVDPSAELDPNVDNLVYHAPLTREHIRKFEGTTLAPRVIESTGEVSSDGSDGYITFPLDDLKPRDEIYIALELPYTYDTYKSMFGATSESAAIRLVFRNDSETTSIRVEGAFGNTSNLLYFNPSKVTDDAFRVFQASRAGSRLGIKTKQDLATLKYDVAASRVCEQGSFIQRYLSDYNYYNEHRNYVAFKNVGDTSGEIFMSDDANDIVEWCKSKFSSTTPQLLNTPDLDNDNWKTFETKPTLAPGEAIVIRSCRTCGKTFSPKFNIILEASGDIRTILNYISLPTTIFEDTMNFYQCSNLTTLPDFSKIVEIGDYGCCSYFRGCGFSTPPDFSNIKSVGEHGFSICFEECYELTTSPDFSNITKVGNEGFEYCFRGCFQLNRVTAPNVSVWDRTAFYCWLAGADPYSSGVLRKPANLEIPTNSESGVPDGWTTEDY